MKLCKHEVYKSISDIWEPKYSTNQILISVNKVTPNIEHYIVRFDSPTPKSLYGWFYLSGKDIRKSKIQPNGRGQVYAVDLDKRQPFEPIKEGCAHDLG